MEQEIAKHKPHRFRSSGLSRGAKAVFRRYWWGVILVLILILSTSLSYPFFPFSYGRSYELQSKALNSLRLGRFSGPAETGGRRIYSDLFAVDVTNGFEVYAAVANKELGGAYNQTIGSYADAGTVSFTPVLANSSTATHSSSSLVVKPVDFDRYHGTYSELSSWNFGTANLTANVWAGYPYARFSASVISTTNSPISGLYSIRWLTLSQTDYFLVPNVQGYRTVSVPGGEIIDLRPNELTDNFIVVSGRRFGTELIVFEKRPAFLSYYPVTLELRIGYADLTATGHIGLVFPRIYLGFLGTDADGASMGSDLIAKQLAHSALSFPTSLRIFYTIVAGGVDVRDVYGFDTASNDWGIAPQPIMPLPYETNATTPIILTLDSIWAPISYIRPPQGDDVTFSYRFTIPSFELPTGANQLVAGSTEAQGIYSSIDYVAGEQQSYGGWDGSAYHDGRVATHLLLLYPLLNSEYKAKVAEVVGRTLTHYYSSGIVYNSSLDAYRFSNLGQNSWQNTIDLGALTAWLFYATALYTCYLNTTFAETNFSSIQKIERAVEGVVDWSGLSWANPDPDTSGELLIETAMTFLLYYHLAVQASNQREMDRAMYFIGVTGNFLHNVFEKPHRYWWKPNLVGEFGPDFVADHVDRPGVQWNWANVIWGMWMPVMAESYSKEYIDGVKETADSDWKWNDPSSGKFDVEYLNFNMILLYLHEPESKENVQLILDWVLANTSEEHFPTAMGRAEEAAQIGYTLLSNGYLRGLSSPGATIAQPPVEVSKFADYSSFTASIATNFASINPANSTLVVCANDSTTPENYGWLVHKL